MSRGSDKIIEIMRKNNRKEILTVNAFENIKERLKSLEERHSDIFKATNSRLTEETKSKEELTEDHITLILDGRRGEITYQRGSSALKAERIVGDKKEVIDIIFKKDGKIKFIKNGVSPTTDIVNFYDLPDLILAELFYDIK
ncbi:hypothetical protein C6W27_09230 [Bacillus paralicheniformis]|uniref:hypothetical protein n=1 Tax=Bacillus paralicheniformis TaxID=1648923 RepID=UPI000D02F10E|nr:hypothetical protein [Bacillus paralicheniformis]PRS16570.1 hypothetical protein C6W27_09230 [Bacillus paralicheniformis]